MQCDTQNIGNNCFSSFLHDEEDFIDLNPSTLNSNNKTTKIFKFTIDKNNQLKTEEIYHLCSEDIEKISHIILDEKLLTYEDEKYKTFSLVIKTQK